MPVVISLQNIVDAIDLPNPEWESFLDPATGEITTLTDEERGSLEDPEPDLLPEWLREQLPKIREALQSDRLLRLPDSFEIHEWSIMERFCQTISEPRERAELLDAIHGSGAFRMFRGALERRGYREQWYSFRDSALERIARDWLESHRIQYK